MDINTDIQYIILFEIFKRFETERLYKVEDISSGPDELRKIVHTVIRENDFINHNNETEEYFFNYINLSKFLLLLKILLTSIALSFIV